MPHLFDNVKSGNCYGVRLMLTQLEVPFTREEVSVIGDRAAQPGESPR